MINELEAGTTMGILQPIRWVSQPGIQFWSNVALVQCLVAFYPRHNSETVIEETTISSDCICKQLQETNFGGYFPGIG